MLQFDSVRQSLLNSAKHAIDQSGINQGDVAGISILAPSLARHLEAAAVKAEAMAAGLSAEIFG